ncbi:FliH/SctL family protein [Cellulomonas algicola]|uniref:FliH/SctL family protein n=1 Tax=Cellulomonas algicola TaxID=2071633 RepID=UPI001C3F58A8|nr:FliH/SctL family protein [Cellulomonas algicola]
MPDLGFVPTPRPTPDATATPTTDVPAAAPVFAAALPGGAVVTPAVPVPAAFVATGATASPVARSAGDPVVFTPSPLAAASTVAPVIDRAASEAARAEGFAAGYAAGAREAARVAQEESVRVRAAAEQHRVAAQAALDHALDTLQAAASAAAARTVPVVAEVDRRLHAAALDLATAVLGIELADHAQGARAVLARVLAQVDPAEPVTVRMHPDDLAAVPAATSATGGTAPTLPATVTLVADATLAAGDAVAELPDGYLDARVTTALARARAALEQA